MAFCYMNGEFIPRDAATLPITDLAIQRGVGVFDSIRTYRRKPFTLTAHLDRLFSSAREARIEPPVTDEALRRVIFDGISRMEGECLIRPFITGGDVNLSGTFPRARFFVLFEPLRPLPPERYAEGVLLPYFDCAPAGVFSRQHAGHIWRRTQGYVGDTALLLTQALLAAFDDGSDTITTAHLDDVALSARAAAGEAELRNAPIAPSRRRSLKVTVT